MKKVLSILLVFLLLFNMFACTKKSTGIATGGTSGTYYSFSNTLAQTMNSKYKDQLNLTVESTGASKANIQLVDGGDDDIAIVQNDVMYYAYSATDMFEGEKPINTFSAIASCYPEAIQIVSNKNINSISELKGKKVSVGDAGSGTEFNAKQILGVYGIDIENDIVKNNQSFADSCDSIKNGTIDAAFVTAGAPTAAVSELATSYDFNILSIDNDKLNQLLSQYKYYTKEVIPANTYSCVKNNVTTVAVMATFIANNKVSEDTIYTFTKSLFEDKNEFQHPKAALLDPNRGISGISIPFHPGAKKYYEEIGLKVE